MTRRYLPGVIVIASWLTANLCFHLSPSTRFFPQGMLIAVIPFLLLAFAAMGFHQSRWIAVICALAVVFALGGIAFHYVDHHDPTDRIDPDEEVMWVMFLIIIVPLEALVAGVTLLAVYLERKKTKRATKAS